MPARAPFRTFAPMCFRRRLWEGRGIFGAAGRHVAFSESPLKAEALRDDGTRSEAFELIRSLIDQIRLVPEDRKLRIELCGELAGILALAADTKSSATRTLPGLQSKSRWLRAPATVLICCSARASFLSRLKSETRNRRYFHALCGRIPTVPALSRR
jgi:hypothetical protein